MGNPRNLVPFTSDQSHEEAVKNGKKGGVESGRARREKRERGERIRMLYGMLVKNPDLLKDAKDLGVELNDIDFEMLADIKMMQKSLQGDVNAYKAQKEEAYGKQTTRQEVEVTGELSGININIKNYEDDDGNRH